jgi:hypothetical protein
MMNDNNDLVRTRVSENWYVGESDGKGDVPAFKLVAYKLTYLAG